MKRILTLMAALTICLIQAHGVLIKDPDHKLRIDIPDTTSMVRGEKDSPLALKFNVGPNHILVIYKDVRPLDNDPLKDDDTQTVWREDYIANLDRALIGHQTLTDSTRNTWMRHYTKHFTINDTTQVRTHIEYDKKDSYMIVVTGPDVDSPQVNAVIKSLETPSDSYTWYTAFAVLGAIALLFLISIACTDRLDSIVAICMPIAFILFFYGIFWMAGLGPHMLWYYIKGWFI